MLQITIPGDEFFNEKTREFETRNDVVIDLEHSLVSVSKWESKHQRPFLSSGAKTREEILDYIMFMIVSPDVDPKAIYNCSKQNLDDIHAYIDSKQSATTFRNMQERRGPVEVITSELIYYWMISFNIDFECQYWHLNRLFALIRVFNVKNNKNGKKMTKHEIAMQNRELNKQRKEQWGTRG